jgi:hypothetical protein
MTDHTKPPATAAALLGLALTAPLNPHGHCFGLIPAGGDWLDDLIDWSRRQFKRPEDAQRIVASWNALVHVPLAQLLEPTRPQSEAGKLRDALNDCKDAVRPAAVPVDLSMHFVTSNPNFMNADNGDRRFWLVSDTDTNAVRAPEGTTGFAGAVVALNSALRALKTELVGEFHEYANEQDEELQAPVQFAAQKIADAMLLLYGVDIDAAPDLAQPCASKYATLPEYSTAMAAWRVQRAAAAGGPNFCKVPPLGWYCTREPGHFGPCAAHPVADDPQPNKTGGTQ